MMGTLRFADPSLCSTENFIKRQQHIKRKKSFCYVYSGRSFT